MKILIVYGTKYGCTKKCAELLKSYLHGEVTVASAKSVGVPLKDYDVVFVGGSVYMGKMRKEVVRFCKRHKKQLMKKRLGIFVCCYTPNSTCGFIETLLPQEILDHASYVTCVGGEMNYEKMNFVYRKTFQMLKRIDDFNKVFIDPQIHSEELQTLAERVMNLSLSGTP